MGSAAHKIMRDARPARVARPALRLVRGGRRKSAARTAAAASGLFRAATLCLVILALAGAARVTFAAQAAEASMDAWELKAEVKAERLTGRALQADRSALAAPSRIEAVACQTLNMGRPAQIAYLQLPAEGTAPTEPTAPVVAEDSSGGAELLATLMDLAAGEAEVMLVGDVGLGSFR